jgi:hypothetical protein
MRLHQLTESKQNVAEAAEDRTSYQIAKILFDKGIRYDTSSKEGELINAIGLVMVKELNMDPKIVRNIISRDDDFLADTLDELYHMSQGVKEDDNGEYDDESGMAKGSLQTMSRAVSGLMDTIQQGDNLPEWVQAKLTKAEDYLTTVWDYLLSQKEQGMDPKVTEASQRVDSLVTDALRIMKGAEVNDAVQALKTILGDREYNSRRGHYNFYVRQILDMYSQQGTTESLSLDEQFDIIEAWVEQLAEQHGVDSEVIWEDFEAVNDRELLGEAAAWRTSKGKNKNGGLNAKGVASYRREHPGSKLQTAVTTKPSKLKKGSKAAKRRKSFCARMGGMKGPMKDDNGKPTRKALALRKWNC